MNTSSKKIFILAICLFLSSGGLLAQTSTFSLESTKALSFVNVNGVVVKHQGVKGLLVSINPEKRLADDDETLVVLPSTNFTNGTIEIELAGDAMPGTGQGARGFVGIAFRMDPENHHQYECIYLRPKNGRAKTQLQRNHSVQYVSHPDYPWYKLRKETPGKYESYVDLIAGAWTKIKIEVDGANAKLYVHGAEQPVLIVDDLKRGETDGLVALWLHRSTKAHYRNLVITSKE